MATNSIFNDIATRTNGDIYIGVVGPCRTGKSTFISKFMKNLVLPKIDGAEKARVIDELPQSGDGIGVMTTQPKFVPAKAVSIKVAGANSATMRVRMIDCVGYLVPGAVANHADGKTRMVKTPWSENEMTFERASEIGTKKVITDHSTIAVVMTTDGTITDGAIPRSAYIEAEDRTIKELKKLAKPFIVIVNSKNPLSVECKKITADIMAKHDVMALAIDVEALSAEHISQIFNAILYEFGISGFRVSMPAWLTVLDVGHEIIAEVIDALKAHTKSIRRLSDNDTSRVFEKSVNFDALQTTNTDVATGVIYYDVKPKPELYFKVLTSEGGTKISNEQELVAFIRHMGASKAKFDSISEALAQVEATGYGVVTPRAGDYTLDTPTLHKRGRDYGVRLRATAPSMHIIRVDVSTEVNPTIGSKEQSEEMLKNIQNDYQNNLAQCWKTNIFGKPLQDIVRDGITAKSTGMHPEAQKKIKRTVSKIVNNGRGGIICILL